MQTNFEYIVAETGKNLIYIIKRITDEKHRVLGYEVIDSYRKYSSQKSFSNEHVIQAYIKSLKA